MKKKSLCAYVISKHKCVIYSSEKNFFTEDGF